MILMKIHFLTIGTMKQLIKLSWRIALVMPLCHLCRDKDSKKSVLFIDNHIQEIKKANFKYIIAYTWTQ